MREAATATRSLASLCSSAAIVSTRDETSDATTTSEATSPSLRTGENIWKYQVGLPCAPGATKENAAGAFVRRTVSRHVRSAS
jgi:hypothetical protein